MRALLVVTLVLVACGGARSTHSNVEPDRTYHGDRGAPAQAPDAGVAFTGTRPLVCPATFPEGGVSCDTRVASGVVTEQCTYPEGSCYCGVTMPCSGVEHSPEEIATWPTTWQCTRPPPAVRPDGCPGTAPGDGASCTSDGKVCGWGDCCFQQMTCIKGAWKTTGGGCPP